MDDIAEHILKRCQRAKERRTPWETYWQECYEYVRRRAKGPRTARGAEKTIFCSMAPRPMRRNSLPQA